MKYTNPTLRMRPSFLLLAALCLVALTLASDSHADKAGDKKRVQLANVRRILVIPPFFGAERAQKGTMSAKSDATETSSLKPNEEHAHTTYIGYLHKLEEHARTYLPERISARTPYQVISQTDVTQALKDLKLTPRQLFQNDGRIHAGKYPQPDLEAIKKVALRLEADAILVGVLDEPRRNGGGYTYTLMDGLDMETPNVHSRAGYFVLLPDGAEVLHDYIEVAHPLTRIGKQEYLLADWIDAEDLVIENLLDEWTRYTPPIPSSRNAKN